MNTRNAELIGRAKRILTENICKDSSYPWGETPMIEPGKGWGGIWNWDSAFHAVGALHFDGELAKTQIRGFLNFCADDGSLPDVVWENGEIERRFSKPPVMAWAANRVCEKTGDTAFAKDVYPVLAKNVRFWEENRRIGGLFRYDADRSDGCTDDEYEKRVRYESGWDDSVRFDGKISHLLPVDLNCFMVMTYRAMAALSDAAGDGNADYSKKAESLAKAVEEKFFCKKLGSYVDFDYVQNAHTAVLTPACFMPLYAKTASADRAEKMNEIAKSHFLPMMPTVAYTDKNYSAQYWRGPCWLNVAYFAAKGLKNYGFNQTAETIRENILDSVYKNPEKIYENYNSLTGEGLCCDHFSWSCSFVLEFAENL